MSAIAAPRIDAPNRTRLMTALLCVAALVVGAAAALPRASGGVAGSTPSASTGLALPRFAIGPFGAGRGGATATLPAWRGLPVAAQSVVSRSIGRDDARFHAARAAGGFVLASSAGGVSARLDRSGSHLRGGGASIGLTLRSVGHGGARVPVAPVVPRAHANRVTFAHPGVSEWYVNGPAGLEQGFTVEHRPAGGGHGDLSLNMGLAANVTARVDADGRGATLRRDGGSLRYAGLSATDARGRSLPAHLRAARGELHIAVDDRGARYPITIDPFVQTAELFTSDGIDPGSQLGYAVAMSGDTIAVGQPDMTSCPEAPGQTDLRGSIRVFVRPASGWADATQVAKLRAGVAGASVAIDGDTIVAGGDRLRCPGDDNTAYVFVRPAAGWADTSTPTATLTISADGTTNPNGNLLGWSVAVSGDTIAVGAPLDNAFDPDTSDDAGAVFVYSRPPGGWVNATQTAKLTASDRALFDELGFAVAMSGDTIVAGAPQGDDRDLEPSPGGPGAAYVFVRPAGGWVDGTQTAKLTAQGGAVGDQLGLSVAISDQTIVAGAPGVNGAQGAAYTYTRPGGGWGDATQTARLTASGGAAGDRFGESVAVAGATIAVGAPHAAGAHSRQGAAYVFDEPGGGWADATQSRKLTAADQDDPNLSPPGEEGGDPAGQSGYQFGFAAAMDTGTIVAGSPGEFAAWGGAFVFENDTTAPDTSITSGPGALTNDSTPTFSFSSTEAHSTFQCRIDAPANDFAPCAASYTTPVLSEGRHVLEVRAVDAAGNADTTPASAVFTVDTIAPDTTIASGPSGPTNTTTPTFGFTSTEGGSTWECRVDTAAYAACATPYTTSALADGPHTFSVRAIDMAGNVDASPASRDFTVDTVSPDTTITGGPTGLTNDATPTFTFSSPDDGVRFQCSTGGSFASCSSPYTVTSGIGQGSQTFSVRAIDAAGNIDPSPATRSFTVDTFAPSTSITDGPGARTSDSTPTFTFSADEAGSTYECRVDTDAFASCTSPFTTSALSDGSHEFDVRATDPAGNTESPAASYAFRVDTTAPDTVITGGPSGPTNDATPTFTFDAVAHDGASYECRVDSDPFTSCTSPLTTAALHDGDHSFEVRATDDVGNTDQTPASRSFTVDTTAPVTTITGGPKGLTSDATPTFTFVANEQGVRFECILDTAAFAPCTSPYTADALADGSHTLIVRAIDAAGNVEDPPLTRSFVVDTTAPDTVITSGPSGTITVDSATFSFTAPHETDATFECRVDAGPFVACTSPYTATSLANGDHTFSVRATDPAGNTDDSPASQSFTVAVDRTPPETTIDSGPAGLTGNSRPTFAFSANEASMFECRIDAGSFASCTSPFTTTALTDGPHTFSVRATDLAGNVDATPATRSFTVDTTPPDTTITSGPSDSFVPGPLDLRNLPRPVTDSSTPSFTFAAGEQGSTFQCRVDAAPWAGCSSPHKTEFLADGPHTFSVRATDAAGNTDPTPASMTFTVAPQCTLVGITIPLGGSPIKVCLVETRASARAADGPRAASAPQLGRVTARLTRGRHLYATGSRRGAGSLDLHATRTVTAGRYALRALGKTADGRTVAGGGTVLLDAHAARQLHTH